MEQFELGEIIIEPAAQKMIASLAINPEEMVRQHQRQNFEPMPEYAFLSNGQMYQADMEKNIVAITRKHGRVYSCMIYGKIVFHLLTNLRFGQAEGTFIGLKK